MVSRRLPAWQKVVAFAPLLLLLVSLPSEMLTRCRMDGLLRAACCCPAQEEAPSSVPVLKAFIAVVLGGLGHLAGAAIGGFLLAAIEVGLRASLPISMADYRDAITLFIVILILVARPDGILGKPSAAIR